MSRLDKLFTIHDKVSSNQIGAAHGLRRYALKGASLLETYPQLDVAGRWGVVNHFRQLPKTVSQLCLD